MIEVERIEVGQVLDRDDLIELLGRMNYARKGLVSRPGEFSVRGNLMDIYPVTYRAPMRIEFRLDEITAIRDFSPTEGKTLTQYTELFLIPVTDTTRKKISGLAKRFEDYEPLTEARDLVQGDYVVHVEYGIGRYLGTKTIQSMGKRSKHLAIEYANREILYLGMDEPVERYIGGERYAPKLTRLHTREWARVKERTRLAVHSVARDLIGIQAQRDHLRGFAFPKNHEWQTEFEAQFPFQETEDQLQATREVKADMESDQPMDRLICGDVGFGKTEVAMRAAFKAVTAGKQVAILVPTTVLAEQHYLVLTKRVRQFPVTVEVLSRFRSRKEQTAVVESVKNGATDIIIGTHRLLSKDIDFKDLGLLVIDEEQRFGVRHKERLKAMRSLVDILTLTATPIPRTLHMALMGVRNMSVINTPPRSRLPIQTSVTEYHPDKVKTAIEKELARGGQVYFIHNRVQSIEKISGQLRDLMPHVRFAVAHGQMAPRELEDVMKEFMEKRIDCLIATNIIESGIDIPNVNTILVNRADHFGLADLYQLRGRVGRYQEKRQAYASFFIPKNWAVTLDAEKRLAAIERFTDLGSGFKIALQDLEIRGAGNLLGHEQSGFIHAVGFDLYCRMLRKAVGQLQEAQKRSRKAARPKARQA